MPIACHSRWILLHRFPSDRYILPRYRLGLRRSGGGWRGVSGRPLERCGRIDRCGGRWLHACGCRTGSGGLRRCRVLRCRSRRVCSDRLRNGWACRRGRCSWSRFFFVGRYRLQAILRIGRCRSIRNPVGRLCARCCRIVGRRVSGLCGDRDHGPCGATVILFTR